MAAKKTKKQAAGKKPAKKKAPAKKAATAKKAAPKKATPKRKPAAKKPAKKPAPKPKKPAPKKPAKEQIEVIETPDTAPEIGTDAPAAGDSTPSLRDEILAMARQLYGDRTDEELLALDPNDIDAMDPSMFYELLGEKYGVQADPDNDYFGGFGGPIRKLIEFVEGRWDGKTRKDTPMPPGDWLEEFVHPETENRE